MKKTRLNQKQQLQRIIGSRITRTVLSFLLLISQTAALAQAPAGNGPIDIQAEQQEFADDHVIAKGKVKVVYKDCVVHAPMATLYRDASGQAQKAVFTGHPHLVQGKNKIDADTLVFEVGSSKVIAEGNAHSDVSTADLKSQQEDQSAPKKPATKADADKAKKGESKAEAKPPADDTGAPVASDTEYGASTGTTDSAAAPAVPPAKGGISSPLGGTTSKPERIITDSDKQEYDRNTGKFEAHGNVRVNAGNIKVKSNHLQLVYGPDGQAEAALFTGNVTATQGQNSTQADTITYFLTTKRMQATGNVKSTVIQANKEDPKKGGPIASQQSAETQKMSFISAPPADGKSTEPILIFSDSQDYSENSGKVTAEGNVRVEYQGMTGVGPKILMLRNVDGEIDKVLFIGRSKISQPGKRWIADRITYTMSDHKVLAEGNTKAIILQTPNRQTPGSGGGRGNFDSEGMLAGKRQRTAQSVPAPGKQPPKLSATKVEAPQ